VNYSTQKESFMRGLRLLIAVAALAAPVAALPALGQVESTPIPAPVKPNFSSLNFLIGTWTCTTKSSRRPAPFQTVSTYTADPSGYWIDETSTTKPISWVPTAITIEDRITYDADTKRWADVSYGTGGIYGLSFSSGWNGTSITWHDVSFAPTADISSQTDTTMTKVSDTKTTSSSAFTEAKSGRTVTVTSTCTR
jgi:hypothetical protein